jgi:hypothetical protein
MFILAAGIWTLTELRTGDPGVRLAGFWAFVLVAVAAVTPATARWIATLSTRAVQAHRVRAILRKTPADLTAAKDYLRSID